ncbi:MAG TPA: 4a-hydroxytetrahydrobiopterin dehydratase [Thermoanaerobaculia bacterium]|nr:4a-hydroxytetrahydrobiopterin dehydratase [Thermoanaerobaculia bacterium]
MEKREPVGVTVFTRRNCSLCDQARTVIVQVSGDAGIPIELSEVDVDGDPHLVSRFGSDVPVVFVGGQYASRHRIDPEAFLQLLRSPQGNRMEPDLARKHCEPCRGGMPSLDQAHAAELLTKIGGGWRIIDDHHLNHQFSFPDFKTALRFVNRVGAIAEEEGHHPDLALGYGRVSVDIWTHAAGGLTDNDFILAAKIDAIGA